MQDPQILFSNRRSSPNVVQVIKSRMMRWAGHVALMDEERGCIGLGGETAGKETTGET